MNKILVIRLSAIGDVLFTLPTVAALIEGRGREGASPCAAEVSWLVEDKAAAILTARRDLAEVIVYPRAKIKRFLKNPLLWPALIVLLVSYVRRIRRERYDLVLDFQGNLKSGIHSMLVRGKRTIGFARDHCKEGAHIFYGEKVVPPAHAVHRVEKAFCLAFGSIEKSAIPRPDLQVPDALLRGAETSIQELLGQKGPPIVMHPGTSVFGAFKRWPAERFGLLSRRLHQAAGTPTLITWGPGEKELAERAAGSSGGTALVAPSTRSILDLAALISHGSLFVAADSGPLHMANLLGVPCVALFGPKDPAIYKPYFEPATVVRTNPHCCPCSVRRCDDPLCMTEMTVDQVFEAAMTLLDGGVGSENNPMINPVRGDG